MGSITDGVMAGLRIRESRRQFEAEQQRYAAESQRQARLDKIAEETRSYEQGKAAYDHFSRDLDRLTADSANTIDQYFKAGEAVRQAQMAVSMASPMKGLQGDSSYEIAARGLKEAMDAQAALRGVATEQKSRISTIRSAMDRISVMRLPSNDTAVSEQQPSSDPVEQRTPTDYAQPAYASPSEAREKAQAVNAQREQMAPAEAPVDPATPAMAEDGQPAPAEAQAPTQPDVLQWASDSIASYGFDNVVSDGRSVTIKAESSEEAARARELLKKFQSPVLAGRIKVVDMETERAKRFDQASKIIKDYSAAAGKASRYESAMMPTASQSMILEAANSAEASGEPEQAAQLRRMANADVETRRAVFGDDYETAKRLRDSYKADIAAAEQARHELVRSWGGGGLLDDASPKALDRDALLMEWRKSKGIKDGVPLTQPQAVEFAEWLKAHEAKK